MSQLPSKYQENQRAPNMDNNPRHDKRYLIRNPFAQNFQTRQWTRYPTRVTSDEHVKVSSDDLGQLYETTKS